MCQRFEPGYVDDSVVWKRHGRVPVVAEGGGLEPLSMDVKSWTVTYAPPMQSDCTIVHPPFFGTKS